MRIVCISLAAALVVGAAQAQQPGQQSPDALGKVYACAPVTDPQARLACFDAAVAGLRAAETQGEFAAVDAARVRQIERDAFGFSLPSLPRLGLPGGRRGSDGAAVSEQPQSQAMKIARLGRFDGRRSFTMENGQVWVLIESTDNRNAEPGASVTIRKAALGSFLMSFEAGGPALRVRRAQ